MENRPPRIWPVAMCFLAPWLIGFVCLTVWPFSASLAWSFCDYDILRPPRFVGGKHYFRLLGELQRGDGVSTALWNTAYFACLSVPLSVALGIGLAVMLSGVRQGQAIMRTILFLPSMVPIVASSILWMWMLDPQDGIVNRLLEVVGLPPQGWLHDYREAGWLPSWWGGRGGGGEGGGFGSKDALVLMSLWGIGNMVVIYSAALDEVHPQLYEAADMDGAGRWRRFLHITLPMLGPVILFNIVMGLIQSVQAFTQVYIVSQGTGDPNQSALVISLHLFLSAFQDLDMGYASAMAWMLFLILAVTTGCLFRSSQKWVFYS